MRLKAILSAWHNAAGEEFRSRVLKVVRFSWRRRAVRALAPLDGNDLVLEIDAPPVAARALERHRARLEELASEALDGRPRVRLHVEVQDGR
jgi:hypothetical protein